MQSETERVLRNLTIVGSILQNDKLNTNDDIFSIYVPTVLRGTMRLWYSEKRSSNALKLQETIRSAISFIQNTSQEIINEINNTYTRAIKERQCKRMFETLKKCKVGMTNLQQTYRDDTTMFAQLQIIMNEVDDFVSITDDQQSLSFLTCSSPIEKTSGRTSEQSNSKNVSYYDYTDCKNQDCSDGDRSFS